MTDSGVGDLVSDFLEALARGDLESASGLFADELDFDIPHAPGLPWIPGVRTRQDLLVFLNELDTHLESIRFEVEVRVVEGNHAVLLGWLADRVRATGRTFESRFSLHVTAEHGFLTRYHLLEDSAAAARAAEVDLV